MAPDANTPFPALARLVNDYAVFLRKEARARGYLIASLVDDAGIAVSAWAMALMRTDLANTQAARAKLMLPTLVCFLLGTVVSGPLADWMARASAARLARWRWQIVLAGRAVETALLGFLVVSLASGPPTIARILPYVMVSAFMKTSLRATRIAFSVDLLGEESPSRGEDGEILRDERGAPLLYKTHLVTFSSLTSLLSTLAVLGGLLAGGAVMDRAGGRTWILFAIDVVTNLGFIAALYALCKPPSETGSQAGGEGASGESGAELKTATLIGGDAESRTATLPEREGGLRRFWSSFAEGFRFLRQPAQRPLLALLAGAWLVEVVNEAYEGKMVIKHVLEGGNDGVRHAEIAWTIVAALGAALLPLLVRRVSSLGKIFLVTMLVDGLVIAAAGHVAAARAATAVLPFAAILCVDRTLTLASTTLTDVAQNSVSSAAMRGRIAGTYALFAIVGDMASEALAAVAEERWGIPGLILRVGLVQVALVALIAFAGGRRLWTFGLRVEAPAPAPGPLVAVAGGEPS